MTDARTRISSFDFALRLTVAAAWSLLGGLIILQANDAWHVVQGAVAALMGVTGVVLTLRNHRL